MDRGELSLSPPLIARNIAGVMASRSGLGPLPTAWALATHLPVLLAISAWRRGLEMAAH